MELTSQWQRTIRRLVFPLGLVVLLGNKINYQKLFFAYEVEDVKDPCMDIKELQSHRGSMLERQNSFLSSSKEQSVPIVGSAIGTLIGFWMECDAVLETQKKSDLKPM